MCIQSMVIWNVDFNLPELLDVLISLLYLVKYDIQSPG